MSRNRDTAAWHLTGRVLDDGWEVVERLESADEQTGAAWSVGYIVQHKDGRIGYLKAFDYASALEAADPARELEDLASSYNCERELLDLCGERRLSRIVRSLCAGTTRVPGHMPAAVSYLIFELAQEDARLRVSQADMTNPVPMLCLARHAAVALAQLHSIGAAHQDIKPSNFLIWTDGTAPEGKLGDLGCAYLPGRPSPFDDFSIAGDLVYAAPEQLYGCRNRIWEPERRRAADVYALGGLICFLLTGVPYNAILYSYVDRSQRWEHWSGSFDDVLPGLIDAHGLALKRLRTVFYEDIAEELSALFDDLCYPDPLLRGDDVARRHGKSPFRLERFISRIELTRQRAAIALRQVL